MCWMDIIATAITASNITAIATIILAIIGTCSFFYVRSQIALMGSNNEANYIKEIINLENKVTDFSIELNSTREEALDYRNADNNNKIDLKKLSKKKQIIVELLQRKMKAQEIIYYNHIENLCFYILHFLKTSTNKVLFDDVKKKYQPYLQNILFKEKVNVTKEDDKFNENYPFIKKLSKKWNIN